MLRGLPPLILQYHRVSGRFHLSGDTVPLGLFRRHLRQLRAWGYRLATPSDWRLAKNGRFLPAVAYLTFDDGFECVYLQVRPEMAKFGGVGAVFLPTAFLGRWNTWDASFGVRFRHLSPRQVQALHREGWLVGSHTHTHRDLTRLTDDEVLHELRVSLNTLERLLGERPTALAYPFGHWHPRLFPLLRRAGITLAFAGPQGLEQQPLALPRWGVYLPDFTLYPKIAPDLRPWEHRKLRWINAFAHLSSWAMHRFPLLAWISRMERPEP